MGIAWHCRHLRSSLFNSLQRNVCYVLVNRWNVVTFQWGAILHKLRYVIHVGRILAVLLETFHACLQMDWRTDLYKQEAVERVRRQVAGLSPRRLRFHSEPDNVRFVVDTVLRFSPAIIIPLMLTSLLCLHTALVKVIKGRIVQTF